MSRVYTPHITDAQQVLTDAEILALMPDGFDYIASLIGISNTLELIEAYGGRDLVIPRKHAVSVNNEIASIIGFQRLQVLAEHFGGDTLEMPKARSIKTYMRNRLILDNPKNESRASLAHKYNLSMRQLRNIINKPKMIKSKHDDRQQDLFGTE